MMATGLERALGMVLLDAAFCEHFFLNPQLRGVGGATPACSDRPCRAAMVRFRESLEPRPGRHRLTDAAAPRDSAVRRYRESEP
jgi:hypothetical protein